MLNLPGESQSSAISWERSLGICRYDICKRNLSGLNRRLSVLKWQLPMGSTTDLRALRGTIFIAGLLLILSRDGT
jgi:hypothetical protein